METVIQIMDISTDWVLNTVQNVCFTYCQVTITAERGDGFTGDIAVDEITFIDGPCPT